MSKIRMWWPKTPLPGNVGDTITKPILEALGHVVERAEFGEKGKFLGAGSIARLAMPRDIVWGSGIISKRDRVNEYARFLAVRGPRTGGVTGCKVYGDPALLCSRLFPVHKRHEYITAVVPHYVDIERAIGQAVVISPLTQNPVATAKLIGSFASVISSSLHGIIIAHAYGVPAGWWRPSNKLSGDDVKFADYAESVGLELRPAKNILDVEMVLPQNGVVETIQQNLLDALQTY